MVHVIPPQDVRVPRVGLGTFKSKGDDVRIAVKAALALGIMHIDTASIYKVVHDNTTLWV